MLPTKIWELIIVFLHHLFGIETATATATARLAKNNNTRVIPYSFIRTKNGYEMSFEKPLENYPSDDPINDATFITNQILEKQINRASRTIFVDSSSL